MVSGNETIASVVNVTKGDHHLISWEEGYFEINNLRKKIVKLIFVAAYWLK